MERAIPGKVIISPKVLKTIVRLTALSHPEVIAVALPGLFKFHVPEGGVKVKVQDDKVWVSLHIIANADVNMYKLGLELQSEIARAIQNITGMEVSEVNIRIEGVKKKS
ncbi:MAG: Asp23/Gls24 family envelope stress response protein [Anaerolineae bacterium]|nr:Asp23/Gls24 family envelope stress response protein [Anaerolineae bacterium]MDW8102546.1 Asp23/Gls24 family envelope stress response protein [Anaerolineae bacterium]